MANKDLYLSNTSTGFGPSELLGLIPGGRALILGRNIDLADLGDLKNYFSIIIAEDVSYAKGLAIPPDIVFWQSGSPYIGDLYTFPSSRDSVFVVNRRALRRIMYAGITTNTYNLAYVPGGSVATLPSVVEYASIGLDPLAPGQHLAKVMGASAVYDTEGRTGTTLLTKQSLTDAVNTKDRYGISTFALKRRYSLVDQI